MTDAGNAEDPGGNPAFGGRSVCGRKVRIFALVIIGLLVALALLCGSRALLVPRPFDLEVFDENGQGQLVH